MLRETPQDYRDRATECERTAESMGDERCREMLRHVASRWRAMADADEQRLARPGQWRNPERRSFMLSLQAMVVHQRVARSDKDLMSGLAAIDGRKLKIQWDNGKTSYYTADWLGRFDHLDSATMSCGRSL